MKDQHTKLKELMMVVVDHYRTRGEPIGSKFLHSLEETEYAPSTLRKYLNILEQEGLLYQPYNSAGRIPTCKGMEDYMDTIIQEVDKETEAERDEQFDEDLDYTRGDLRNLVQTLGEYVDGAVVGFVREDEYYYLGLDNLIKDMFVDDMSTVRYIVKFIESRELVQKLDARVIKNGKIYYTFLDHENKLISIVYTKILLNGYDVIIAIL
jgi:transcriptional regulator of heat shock response